MITPAIRTAALRGLIAIEDAIGYHAIIQVYSAAAIGCLIVLKIQLIKGPEPL